MPKVSAKRQITIPIDQCLSLGIGKIGDRPRFSNFSVKTKGVGLVQVFDIEIDYFMKWQVIRLKVPFLGLKRILQENPCSK